jgi:hypothetical protein
MGDITILQGMVDIFQDDSLLRIESHDFTSRDVEKGGVKISGVLGQKMASLDRKLKGNQYHLALLVLDVSNPQCLHALDQGDNGHPDVFDLPGRESVLIYPSTEISTALRCLSPLVGSEWPFQ